MTNALSMADFSVAEVWGIDISQKQVEIAVLRSEVNGVGARCHFSHGDALKASFPDGYFDIVIGTAILHHLDMEQVGKELYRVVRPGGFCLFMEPLGENPLLSFIRDKIPYSGKHRTDDEHPLQYSDIQILAAMFSRCEVYEYQLLGMLERATGKHVVYNMIEQIDAILIKVLPFLKRLCRIVFVKITR